MPGVYQHYLNVLLQKAREVMSIKTLNYDASDFSDYSIIRYGWRDRFQHLLFKLHLSTAPSLDLKIMQEFDIVHIQHSFLWKRLIPLLELKKRPKIVITLRGGDTYLKPWTFIRMAEYFEGKSHLIDAFVVMSQHQKDYLMRWGVSEHKIQVIPISFGGHSAVEPKRPTENKLKLISAFRMTWEKNIQGHIQFANILKKKNIAFEYDIYGEGKDLDQLYYLVDRYNLQSFVNIKGKISNEALQNVFVNYDFCVQLSISESLGMSVIEAQSKGVPCIVSDAGGLPEVVLEGETGLIGKLDELATLVDSCIELWSDAEKYASYSKKALHHVNSRYTLAHELMRLEKLYVSI